MRNLLAGNVMLIGATLVGYSLACPFKLANYFYEKPLIDYIIYLVLFCGAFFVSRKFFSQARFFKYLVFSLLIIPLLWLKLDYWLYSKVNSPQFVTYIFILISGASAYAVLKYPIVENIPRWAKFPLLAFPLFVGFIISIFSTNHDFSEFLVLYFSVGLAATFWHKAKLPSAAIVLVTFGLIIWSYQFDPPEFFESQSKYHDKVVFSRVTDVQTVDVTEWKGNYWFYTDKINQFSSIDSWLFYEPFAYPALELADNAKDVLVIGGENGMLVHELMENFSKGIDLLPLDRELLEIAQSETLFTETNDNSLSRGRLNILNDEVFSFLDGTKQYDLIYIDVPDPVNIERNQYFTQEFYKLIKTSLKPEGYFITQSGSPYFATEAFDLLQKTISDSGFNVLAYHNQILTLGEWSWTIGSLKKTANQLKEELSSSNFEQYNTQWLNQEAMQMMLSFGKATRSVVSTEVNTMKNPVLYKYYLNGNYTFK